VSAWEHSVGQSNDWYTPSYVFDALGETFDLDVAAPVNGPLHVPTSRWFSSASLEREWFGFVWMNAPFEGRNGLSPWLTKFFDHGNGIALTPDRTSAPWFQEAWPKADAILFTPKIKFIRPDGSLGRQPGNGTALWAAGERAIVALRRANLAGLGIIGLPGVASHLQAVA
jgi:hypothetical protein